MYLQNNEFEYCCGKPNKVQYNIAHNPVPINLLPEIRDSIERLLWYVPCIDSVQSLCHPLIDDPLYSEPIFDFILETMKISKIKDVCFEPIEALAEYNEFYNNEICTSCQKIILTKTKQETAVRAMLRHIRNAIAHGSFTVVNDLLFFKDTKTIKNVRHTTAIIKINANSLKRAIELISDNKGVTQEQIIVKAFEYLGFHVQRKARINNYLVDMIIQKDGMYYALEIKESVQKKLGFQDPIVDREIKALSMFISEGITPVLIFDKMDVSDKAKERLKQEGIILLDKKEISKLLEVKELLF